MSDDVSARKGLTFGQAEGVEPLPTQLAPTEVSPHLRAKLWAIFHRSLEDCAYTGSIIDPWRAILLQWFINREFGMIDEFSDYSSAQMAFVKKIFVEGDYIRIFNFVQFVCECDTRDSLPYFVKQVLKSTHSAYRLIDNMIVPISSPEQAAAIEGALALAAESGGKGARTHLRAASKALSVGEWAASIRESIHAVEAAAKSIEPSAETLGPALTRLKTSIGLSPALAKAFGALYGWSSDQDGVRHALVFEEEAAVGEREAMFMFGACASFVGYLLSAKRVADAGMPD